MVPSTNGLGLARFLLKLRFRDEAPLCQLSPVTSTDETSVRNMKRKLIAFLLASAPFNLSQAGELVGAELHQAVSGKVVYVSTPLGEVPIHYAANGNLTGRTDLALLDGESTPFDRGRWWVSDKKLCIQWQNWMGGKPHCFTMRRVGPNAVYWRRDDGKTGTARLG
jgi:hypothetical protein